MQNGGLTNLELKSVHYITIEEINCSDARSIQLTKGTSMYVA